MAMSIPVKQVAELRRYVEGSGRIVSQRRTAEDKIVQVEDGFLFNDVKQIEDAISAGDTSGIRLGMQQTLSRSKMFEFYLHDQWKAGVITLETAREYAPQLTMFEQIRMGTYMVPRPL